MAHSAVGLKLSPKKDIIDTNGKSDNTEKQAAFEEGREEQDKKGKPVKHIHFLFAHFQR